MPKNYAADVKSLGTTYALYMQKPALTVVTGRGTHSVSNKKGAMAVITHAMMRLLMGQITVPYKGSQDFVIYDLSAAGLELLKKISNDWNRGRVSTDFKNLFL